ncbi:MAG: hypothetical protein P8X89_07395 [Reinekea sp.]
MKQKSFLSVAKNAVPLVMLAAPLGAVSRTVTSRFSVNNPVAVEHDKSIGEQKNDSFAAFGSVEIVEIEERPNSDDTKVVHRPQASENLFSPAPHLKLKKYSL